MPRARSKTVVPPGELVRINVHLPRDRPELRDGIEEFIRSGKIEVRVGYKDVFGSNPQTTVCHIERGEGGSARIRQVGVNNEEGTQVFLSGPADALDG